MGTWLSRLGGERLVQIIREKTHTCYKGVHADLHAIGAMAAVTVLRVSSEPTAGLNM